MSWIVIDAIDNDRVMQEMHIHVKVHFRKDFMNTPRARMMRDGLLAKLQEVADHYFKEVTIYLFNLQPN